MFTMHNALTFNRSSDSTLPPPKVPQGLIAARVPELERGLAQDLAIACEQPEPKRSLRQRLAEKLRSLVVAETPAASAYDMAGYYPVRRPSCGQP